MKRAYVYILRCADGTLYTGWTTDPGRRLAAHNSGKGGGGAKYTAPRRPCTLVYTEVFENEDPAQAKREAMSREWFIKNKLSRDEKEELIASASAKAGAASNPEGITAR